MASNEIVAITNASGIIQYVNPAFEKITGFSGKDAIGETPRILKSGHHNRAFYEGLGDTILSGNPWTGRLTNKRKNGTLYTGECSISPVKDENGRVVNFVWISRDITNELELQKRVPQAQKMEAIGALAGGIAHDFNNILYPIIGFSEMLMEDLPAGSPERENVEVIFKAAKRAGDIVTQILSGDKLTAKLRLIKAGIPVIICTGFSVKIDEQKAKAIGVNGCLMKPVVKSDMARMVRKILDEAKR